MFLLKKKKIIEKILIFLIFIQWRQVWVCKVFTTHPFLWVMAHFWFPNNYNLVKILDRKLWNSQNPIIEYPKTIFESMMIDEIYNLMPNLEFINFNRSSLLFVSLKMSFFTVKFFSLITRISKFFKIHLDYFPFTYFVLLPNNEE